MDKFIVNIIHRPEMVPEYSATVTGQGKEEDIGDKKLITYKRSEMGQVELAYVLTVHLAQGSGYKTVIVAIDTTHYILLDSCLLYTALTRSKERCLLSQRKSSGLLAGLWEFVNETGETPEQAHKLLQNKLV